MNPSEREPHSARPATVTPKTCGACGESFSCCADADLCWCKEVELDERRLLELREAYADCLCPRCLDTVGRERPESA